MFILSSEGYAGYGLDLRARKSWDAYSPRPDLRTTTLDPPAICTQDTPFFPKGSFLIGNHADEVGPLSRLRLTTCARALTITR